MRGWKMWYKLQKETRPQLDIPDLLIQVRNYEVKLNEWENPSHACKIKTCIETTELIIDPGEVGEWQKEPNHLVCLQGKKEVQEVKHTMPQILCYWLPMHRITES